MHVVLLAEAANVPTAHGVHDAEPADDDADPAAQTEQPVPPAAIEEPGGHDEHDVAPASEYVPGPHTMQTAIDVAPIAADSVPDGQGTGAELPA